MLRKATSTGERLRGIAMTASFLSRVTSSTGGSDRRSAGAPCHLGAGVTRLLAIASLLIVVLASTPSASAADGCALTDPNCVLDTVDETVASTRDEVEDTAQPVVDEVGRQVDGLLGDGGGGDDPGDDPSPGGGGPRPDNGGKHDAGRGNDARQGSRDPAGSPRVESRTPVPPRGLASDPISPSLLAETDDQAGVLERIGEAGARAAKSLALLLVLAGLVVGFVLIQDRLDRRDPKLALAPLESDDLRFT